MNTSALSQTFGQTTVDPRQVEGFLLSLPRYYELGRELGVSQKARMILYRTDGFEFELRQYLAGETRTRYHLNRSVRFFLALDQNAARTMILYSLDAVRDRLLASEWYEIMPRYEKTRQHICKTFNI